MTDRHEFQEWWEEKWKEREELLRSQFGETEPPGEVMAFFWKNLSSMIPGGCSLVFPPHYPERQEWLTIGLGLSQPLSPNETSGRNKPSGFGCEYAFLSRQKENWTVDGLGQLMTYRKQSGMPIEQGHRVPMWYYSDPAGNLIPNLGRVENELGRVPIGEMRAIVFWPYLSSSTHELQTSTGFFT